MALLPETGSRLFVIPKQALCPAMPAAQAGRDLRVEKLVPCGLMEAPELVLRG